MMPRNRDEKINDIFELIRAGKSAPSGTPEGDLADARALADCTRLLRIHRPEPSNGFADRVVARLHTEVVSASTIDEPIRQRSWRTIALASGAAALAASLLLAVTISSNSDRQRPSHPLLTKQPVAQPMNSEAPVVVEKPSLPDTVRQGTVAYMELVDELASTLSAPAPQPAVQLTSASPLGRAVEGSSRTIRNASEGLRVSVEPITSSAIDAFGFLWRPAEVAENKPST
jgi:hypothetical protein